MRPGESIAQIAPSHASMVVKARVVAQDIGKIKVCKQKKVLDCQEGKVQLRFSAYPYPDYGTLKGAIRAIAPDVIAPQSSSAGAPQATSGSVVAPYYEVTIQPERPYFMRSNSPSKMLPSGKGLALSNRSYPIQPGMEATADIITREETVLKFILRKARLLTDL